MTEQHLHGGDTVAVLLDRDGSHAVLMHEDKAALDALGVPHHWFVRFNRVVYMHPIWSRRYVQIARILTACQFGQSVRYRDRNPLNLCRDNLERVKGDADTCPLEELLKELPAVLASRLSAAADMDRIKAFVARAVA
jgi:hypothetical protein